MLDFIDVCFSYSRKGRILDSFSWSIPDGRTLFLGPNGAGKSTVLKIGAGLLRPERGTLRSTRSVGYMPQSVRAVGGMNVVDQVAYVAWLKGLSRRDAMVEARAAVQAVDLDEYAQHPASKLSGGQLRRVGVAQAMVGDSGVLLLDEPTAGLDPAQRTRFDLLISTIDRPVVVATHQIDSLDVYDRVLVLTRGAVRFDGPMDEFLDADPRGTRSASSAYTALTRDATPGRQRGLTVERNRR